jgi:hypothetical protein
MPTIYDINYNQKAIELLPPDKRSGSMIQWAQSLFKEVQYNRDALLTDYKVGSSYPSYSSMATYAKFDRVIYGQSVYESLVSGNTATPTDATKWKIYQDYFIGVNERITYNHCKLVLEFALNRRFYTTFRQPPSVSDIYITTNAPTTNVFVVGAIESKSSIVYTDRSLEFVINSYTFGTTFYNFTVYVPTAVYNAVGSTENVRQNTFKNFIDKYNTAGLIYNVVTY